MSNRAEEQTVDYSNIYDGIYSDDDYADACDWRAAMHIQIRAEEREEAELWALEDEQLNREAEERVTSTTHTVRRHTEFYPLHPDVRGWSIAEVDAAMHLD